MWNLVSHTEGGIEAECENCAVLGYYAASSVNSPTAFRDLGPETLAGNCHYTLRNDPEDRSSHLLRDGSLKSSRVRVFEMGC